jgi:nucleotide-binding universal stress UspA family protein
MFDKIVIAHDGSDGAAKAFNMAVDLSKRHKSKLLMVSVEELPNFPTTMDEVVEEQDEAERRFTTLIKSCEARARSARVKLEAHVVAGHAVTAIVEFIETQRPNLLVIGYMGHSALYNRLIGSTTDRLVELAPCAVMVVK